MSHYDPLTQPRSALTLGAAALTLLLAVPARAVLVPGGGPARTDCYVEFDVRGAAVTPPRVAECTDGDPNCDADGTVNDSCTFQVALCANQTNLAPDCTPPFPPTPLAKIGARGLAKRLGLPTPPVGDSACGAFLNVDVPVKVRKNGQVKRPGVKKLAAFGVSPSKPKKDNDTVRLVCNPNQAAGGIGGLCPVSPSGSDAPNAIRLTVADAGSDLDNGRNGLSHNFPIPANTKFQLCLTNCNATDDPNCDTSLTSGEGTFNGTTFGAPLPLFSAGVPVCVVNRWAATQGAGTANLMTGAIDGTLRLESDVFLTDSTDVCPRCETGTCNGGPNRGRPCTVDGQVFVAEAATASKLFHLSKDCPPPSDVKAGTLIINLPLTTGTSTLAPLPGGSAATPCVRQPGEPAGLTPQPDVCPAGGTCTGTCGGLACATMGTDFVTGLPVCIDEKGGVSQLCCSNAPTIPCFPTGPGSAGVVSREGKALVPQPTWPDPTYPKTTSCTAANCTVEVGAFCEAATGSNTVDGITGLPGPGAIILPVSTEWLRP
jgi:hypothetical protein